MAPRLFLISALLLAACARRPVVAVKPGYDFSKVKRVAMLGFDDAPRRRGSGEVVASMFERELIAAGFSVVERRRAEQLLKEQRLSVSGAVDPKMARRIGRLLGVDAFVMGSVTEYRAAVRENYFVDQEEVRREPIVRRVTRKKNVDGEMVVVEEDEIVGYNNIRTVRQVPQTRSEPAEVGAAARMVDVESGEVLWSGSTTESAFTIEEAAARIAQRVLEAVQEERKKGRMR